MVASIRWFGLSAILLCVTPIAIAATPEDSETLAPLYAAMGSVEITPPVGVPLAGHGSIHRRNFNPLNWFNGYSFWLKPSEGVLDPIRAKALILKRGEQRLLFMSMDLVGVNKQFQRELAAQVATLGFRRSDVFVSGTHTHNGPGNISDNPVWQIVAADRYISEVYDGMMEKTVALVKRIEGELQPAFLFSARFEAQGIQLNRRDQPGHFDPSANLLLVKNLRGEWLGAMANLAVHGTTLHPSNLLYSADIPGAIEQAFGKRLADENPRSAPAPTVLFINGAEGDVAPAVSDQQDRVAMGNLGQLFAEQAMKATSEAEWIWPRWTVRESIVEIGRPYLRLANCVDKSFIKWILFAGIRLGSFFPKKTRISVIELGDMVMMTWPGEPTTSLGQSLKDMAMRSGARQAWVLGLTNDHLSYFVTPEEYESGGYESCSSLYGPEAGLRILDGYRSVLGVD